MTDITVNKKDLEDLYFELKAWKSRCRELKQEVNILKIEIDRLSKWENNEER